MSWRKCAKYSTSLRSHVLNGSVKEKLGRLVNATEEELYHDFQYGYGRRMGQLMPLAMFLVESDRAEQIYLEQGASLGQRLGNVKPARLHSYQGWSFVFPGSYFHNQPRPPDL